MKRRTGIYLIYILAVLLIPAVTAYTGTPGGLPDPDPFPDKEAEQLTLTDGADGRELAVTMREYLVGALAAEADPAAEPEALKAQAVALHSWALYLQAKGEPITVDTERGYGYRPDSARRTAFGAQYAANEQRLTAAVDAVLAYILTYESRPAAACYHAISPGRTEDSGNVFSEALPYLKAVDCAEDIGCEGYLAQKEVTPQQLTDALHALDDSFSADGQPEAWVGRLSVSPSGTVLAAAIGSRTFSGGALREALGLRSAAFTVRFDGENFIFETKGFGHGVGMSLHAANEMAGGGATFDAILARFYPGTSLGRAVP